MARIYARKENNRLVIDFSYRGKRCREQTSLEDTRENRKRVQKLLDRIEAEIAAGCQLLYNACLLSAQLQTKY